MKNLIQSFALLFALTTIFSCQAPATETAIDMDAVRAEIQAMEDAFAAASNARDAEAQVAYYADDANSLVPDMPTLVGKEAILARAKAEMAENPDQKGNISFEIIDLYAAGDIAVEVGKWTYTPEGGEASTGKFMSLFEKRDGKYICIRDIFNSDAKDKDNDDDDHDHDDGEDDDKEEGS